MPNHLLSLAAVGLTLSLAQSGHCGSGQTVEKLYFSAVDGPLRKAQLSVLPAGVLVTCGSIRVKSNEVDTQIADAPEPVRAELKKHTLYVAEQILIRKLLEAKSKEWGKKRGNSASGNLDAYLSNVLASVKATEAEKHAFFQENSDAFGGASYKNVANAIEAQVLAHKRQAAFIRLVDSLASASSLRVDSKWCQKVAPLALNNPVSKARRSGKPSLVDFGSKGCMPCDKLAPILERLKTRYAKQCTVLFVSVRDERVLAQRYGISSIPLQTFYGKDGREVSRHSGFWPESKLIEQLAMLGIR